MNNYLQHLNFEYDFEYSRTQLDRGLWFDGFVGEDEKYWIHNLKDENALMPFKLRFKSLGRLDFWLMKLPPKGKIRWHIDHNREASLIFPLTSKNSLFFELECGIYEFFYEHRPIILNVKKKHKVLNNSNEFRYALYGSIFDYTYNECLDILQNHGLIDENK